MPDPSYFEFFNKTLISFREFGFDSEKYPHDLGFTIRMLTSMQLGDMFCIFIVAVVLTILRVSLTHLCFVPFASRFGLTKASQEKFPESIWKLIFYSIAWIYSYYIVIGSGRYDFFDKPLNIWRDTPDMENYTQAEYLARDVPADIRYMYLLQLGFYFHSIYGTIRLDIWRKDSTVMLFHHFLTIFLLEFSYLMKYYKIGALVLFLHDFSDVLLEFTKLNVYMKDRDNKYFPVHEHLSNFGFLAFATSWAVMRLYWFPLKVIYSTTWGVYSFHRGKDPKMFLFFNSMLITLQLMHIWWFWFVLVLLYKVLSGKSKEVDDTREYDEQMAREAAKREAEEKAMASGATSAEIAAAGAAAAAAVVITSNGNGTASNGDTKVYKNGHANKKAD